MTNNKIDGVSVLKSINLYQIDKIDLNKFNMNVAGASDNYVFYYDYENDHASLYKNDNIMYETNDPIESMDMFIYLKSVSKL